jgi:GMP synthase (glutamine-hydrolysing)
MRILCLVHVPFEDAANVETWACMRGHSLRYAKLYRGDFLAVMGGTMNIYEHEDHPWLLNEKRFIRQAIDAGKKVLGVCLGAQLIADVLGGIVTKNRYPEIGWHTVQLTPQARQYPLFGRSSDELTVFQWHGDTFALPPGAISLASSQACENQAFLYGSNVLGLQFHLEYSQKSIMDMLTNCAEELVYSPYVQTADTIRQNLHLVAETELQLYAFLDHLTDNDN